MLFRKLSGALDHSRLTTKTIAGRHSRFIFGPADVGDTLDNAKDIGTIKTGKSYNYSGDVGGPDLDYYGFKVDKARDLSFTLDSDESNGEPIAFTILNRNGKPLKDSAGKFLFRNVEVDDSGVINASLNPGKYAIRIQSANGRNEDYDLKIAATSKPTLSNAKDLGTLEPGRTYDNSGFVGDNNIDYLRFNVNGISRFTAKLFNDSLSEPIALSILDKQGRPVKTQNGRYLFSNVESGDTGTIFAPTLANGTYYARVQSALGSNEEYRLSLQRSSLNVTPL